MEQLTQPDYQTKKKIAIREHIVEIASDSGEGAQTAGQIFGIISAKMGNGVWTVELIPAEIEPPPRSRAGVSGNRIRLGEKYMTNAGDLADVVIGFNEQVLYSRIDMQAYRPGTQIFLESKWSMDPDPSIREAYAEAVADFKKRGYEVFEVPMESECLKSVVDARRGKNVWVLGLLSMLYQRDMELIKLEIRNKLAKKGEKVIQTNYELLQSGFDWAMENLDFYYDLPCAKRSEAQVVMNGNQALALGAMAAGIEVCAMYPITPATSVSHHLSASFSKVGGFVHQAEDEIAAMAFAIGASYSGKTAMTVTSGPGLALKTELIGLAVIGELPLVLVNVQRGGPSTGLPTKVEQADLLAALFASPGDAPKIIIAPSTIEECFHFMVTARKLAEDFRMPVFLLSDANLATGVQPFKRPEPDPAWLSPPLDQSDWNREVAPFDWDETTGLSQRPIPGQRDGMYVLTGLAHDRRSRVAYESSINQHASAMRSRKMITLLESLNPPQIYGDPEGDLLVVGWGSTRGAIEEAVDRQRAAGAKVSAIHLRFLAPLEPGLKPIFQRFKKVLTVEINYSDIVDEGPVTQENRRYAQLAMLLRAKTLCDVDCWSRVPGGPLSPAAIENALSQHLKGLGG